MRDKIGINTKKVFKSNDNMLIFIEDLHALSEGLYKCNQAAESIATREKNEENANEMIQIVMEKMVALSLFIKQYKAPLERLEKDIDASQEEIDFLFKKMRGEDGTR